MPIGLEPPAQVPELDVDDPLHLPPGEPAADVRVVEPGQEREVELVDYAGAREVYGFRAEVMGSLETKP